MSLDAIDASPHRTPPIERMSPHTRHAASSQPHETRPTPSDDSPECGCTNARMQRPCCFAAYATPLDEDRASALRSPRPTYAIRRKPQRSASASIGSTSDQQCPSIAHSTWRIHTIEPWLATTMSAVDDPSHASQGSSCAEYPVPTTPKHRMPPPKPHARFAAVSSVQSLFGES